MAFLHVYTCFQAISECTLLVHVCSSTHTLQGIDAQSISTFLVDQNAPQVEWYHFSPMEVGATTLHEVLYDTHPLVVMVPDVIELLD